MDDRIVEVMRAAIARRVGTLIDPAIAREAADAVTGEVASHYGLDAAEVRPEPLGDATRGQFGVRVWARSPRARERFVNVSAEALGGQGIAISWTFPSRPVSRRCRAASRR